MLANTAAELEPVHAGHVHVEQGEVDPGVLLRQAAIDRTKRLFGALRAHGFIPFHAEELLKHLHDRKLIVHDKQSLLWPHSHQPHVGPNTSLARHRPAKVFAIIMPSKCRQSIYHSDVFQAEARSRAAMRAT